MITKNQLDMAFAMDRLPVWSFDKELITPRLIDPDVYHHDDWAYVSALVKKVERSHQLVRNVQKEDSANPTSKIATTASVRTIFTLSGDIISYITYARRVLPSLDLRLHVELVDRVFLPVPKPKPLGFKMHTYSTMTGTGPTMVYDHATGKTRIKW